MSAAVNNNDPFKLYAPVLHEISRTEPPNRNLMIQTLSECLKTNTCPMNLRFLKEAQHSYEGLQMQMPDNQSINIKSFSAATVGSALAIGTRVVRTAVRTLCLPVSIPCIYGKASRYNLNNAVATELQQTKQEWVDLGVSVLCVPMGLIKTVKPDAFAGTINDLSNYYVTRIDERTMRDKYVATQIQKYEVNLELIKKAWKLKNPPPQINLQNA